MDFFALYCSVTNGVKYSNDVPFRTLRDSSVCEILYYLVEVYPKPCGDIYVRIRIDYHVIYGTKLFGFKQFLMPTFYAYITNVTVFDDYGELRYHVTKDHEYIEIGWIFSIPIREDENRSVILQFTIAKGVIDYLFINGISLPNAGRFRITVHKKIYRVYLPKDYKPLNYEISYETGKYNVIEIHGFDTDPPTILTEKFYSSQNTMFLAMSIVFLIFLTLVQYVYTLSQQNSKFISDITTYPASYVTFIVKDSKKAFWATVYAVRIFGLVNEKEKVVDPKRKLRPHELVVAELLKCKLDYEIIYKRFYAQFLRDLHDENILRKFGVEYWLLSLLGIVYGFAIEDYFSLVLILLNFILLAIFLAKIPTLTETGKAFEKKAYEFIEKMRNEIFSILLEREDLLEFLPVLGFDNPTKIYHLSEDVGKISKEMKKKLDSISKIVSNMIKDITSTYDLEQCWGLLSGWVPKTPKSSGGGICFGCTGCSACGGCGSCGGCSSCGVAVDKNMNEKTIELIRRLKDVPLPLLFKMKYPFFLQVHVTERCNLRCKHCYSDQWSQDMSWELFVKLINDFKKLIKILNCRGTVYLTGGEPLLWPHIFDAIKLLRKKKLVPRVLTNGTLIDEKVARKLKKSGVKYVQVSLDGGKEIHESIRGKGTFDKAISGIKNLVKAGIEVTIMVTIMKRNIKDVPYLLDLAEKLGVKRIAFQRLVPIGCGKNIYEEILTPKEVAELLLFLNSQRRRVEIIKRSPFWRIIQNNNFVFSGCSAGNFGMAVLPDGTVLPCRRLPIPVGNITRESLIEIYFLNPFMKKLRNRENCECSDCPYISRCYGCRGIAYAVTGNPFAKDPQCPLDFLKIN